MTSKATTANPECTTGISGCLKLDASQLESMIIHKIRQFNSIMLVSAEGIEPTT